MRNLNIYPKLFLVASFLALGFSSAFGQLYLKLQLMDDSTWGVYVKPIGVTPTSSTITGSGQVTIVMPASFSYTNMQSVSGTWQANAVVIAPVENDTMKYVSFGLITDSPKIIYVEDEETLLFTFKRPGICPDSIYLIDCNTGSITDPFCPDINDATPGVNSMNSNPGNEFSVIDFGASPTGFYGYSGNYAPSAWSCHDCDGDGILNAFEDTNGNGTFDPGIDSSAICDPCDPIHVETATLSFAGLDGIICAGDAGDTAYLIVDIVGGWVPYTVVYTDGVSNDTITNFQSGDSIAVVPTASTTYDIVNVIDAFGCAIDPDSIFGNIQIVVEGPLSITDEPDDVTECSGNGTTFSITAANAGAGTIAYQWQVSDDSTNWTYITNGTPYSNANTATLTISNVAGLHGRCYRAAISTPHCDTVFSDMACLSVEGPISVAPGGNPSNVTLCAGSTATFTGSGQNAGAVGTLSYIWQQNSGSGWVDLTNGGAYSGTTTGTVTINPTAVSMDGYQFRMKIFTGECSDTVFTTAATLDIEGPISITNDPDNVSNCAGNEVFFISEFSNPGGGTTFAQWQIADNAGGPWSNISNVSGVYTGVTSTNVTPTGSDTLTITNVIGLNGKWYRVIYTSPLCTTAVPSAAAQLTVNGNVAFSDHPDDITVCSGNDTVFVAAASLPAGQGTFTWGWQYSNDDGATWTTITFPDVLNIFTHSSSGPVNSGTDTLKISDVGSMYNFRFRAMAISAFCETVYSNEARLAIEGPLTVTQQPTGDNVLCSGQGTLFTATIDNPGVAGSTIYRWQASADSSTWIDLSNANGYNGTGTPSLSISNSSGKHGLCYRLSARTSTCNIIFTNEICLTVEGPITVTDQPDNVALCSGESTFFKSTASVVAGTLGYQWQVSSDNGVNWVNLSNGAPYSGVTDTILNISNVAGLYNRCYRMRFVTGECSEVFSEKACLTVEGPITIADQPDDVTQCSGEPVLFIVDGNNNPLGGTIQYLWQESTDNGNTWNDLDNVFPYNGTKTDTLSISNTVGKDSNLYRVLLWTGECATITSDSARLFIEGPITFTDQPDNVTECSGEGTLFQATYANPGTGTVLTQWERSCDNGVTWVNVSNDSIYSGATTTSLNISDVAGLTGCRFRLKAWTATCDTLYSNYAQLTVEGPLNIALDGQPESVTICSGGGTSFSVEVDSATAGQLFYQWQTSWDGGTTWFNVNNNSTYNGATSSNLSISNVSGLNGRCYRVNIQTATCPAINSATACLTVEGPVTFTDHPDNVTQCSAESVMFIGAAAIGVGNAGTISYQWQTSVDGINWPPVTDGTPAGYIGSTNDTLIITNVAGLNGRRYRLTATTGVCSQVNSNPAILTVEGPLTLTSQPQNVTTCDDKEVIFGALFTNPGQGVINYQWQQSTDNGVTWTNLSNGTFGLNIINGTKTDSLSISPVTGLNGTRYRLRGWTGTCDTLTTNAVTLGVEGPLVFDDHPDDVTLCSNGSTYFDVDVTNTTGVGTIQYQWEVSGNGGISWSNLSNGGVYSGVATDSLVISDVTGLGNRKYRCKIRTGSCDWDFSQLATLFVEGPITVSLQPVDAAVCSNVGHIFNTTVTNPGSGVLAFQWQLSEDDGATWANINNGANGVNGGTWQGTKTMDLNISLVEGMDSFMFRLLISTATCADTSDEVLLTVLDACLAGACDNDLDGIINDNDPDDDNDQLTDYWEAWMTDNNIIIATTEFPGTGPWNYQDNNNMLINYDRCVADSDGDGIIDGLEDPDGDLLSNNEETDADGILDGNPLDPCHPVLGPTCIGINLAIKVYLQGAIIGNSQSDTLMRDNLRNFNGNNLIPLTEPYSGITNVSGQTTTYPFQHKGDGGGEEVTDLSIFDTTGANAIVDWVFVELRSSTALDSVISTRAGLLQRDGDVVDTNGVSTLRYLNAPAGPYYVAVRHRNHLGVMTAEALDLSPIVTEIDFTDTSYLTNGINAQVKLTLNGQPKMALWAGDLNSDGRTIYQGPANDILQLFTTVMTDPNQHPTNKIANFITQGYHRADIDLNGRAIYQGPGNDRAILLFNTTLIFPENDADPDIPGSNPLANYIIFQQLP